MRATRTGFALIALAVFVAGCARELPRLDHDRRRVHEARPGVVRVSSFATATFAWSAADIERAATSLKPFASSALLRRPAAADEVETGSGGSASGFIAHADGFVVTDADAPHPPRDPALLDRELRRNGAKAALARYFDAELLEAASLAGRVGNVVEELATAGTLDRLRVVDEVDLANGTRLPYSVVASSERLAGSARIALLRIDRRNLPSFELAGGVRPKPGARLWVVGYPAIATRGEDALGGWAMQDAELEAAFNPGDVLTVPGAAATLQTNAAVYEGNSGGPVIGRDDGRVVGLAFRGSTDGRKLILTADAVAAMLAGRVKPSTDRGRFQETYAAALDAAERGDWASAHEKLAQADALFPDFPDLVRLISEAERNQKAEGRLARIAIPVAVIAGLVIVAILASVMLRRGSRRRPKVEMPPVTSEHEAVPRGRAPGTRGPSLGSFVVVSGARRGERILLSGPVLVLGREPRSCDVVLDHPKVSRVHAELVDEAGRTELIDRGSANGTWLNGEKIGKRILEDGDIIYFGGANAVVVVFGR